VMLARELPRESSGPIALRARRRAWRLDERWRLLLAVLCGKLTVLLVVFMAYTLLPFYTDEFKVNFVDPAVLRDGLARAFSTWDAQHYLYLSESGYHAGQMSDAFFPLFPLLIHITTPIFGSSLAAGLVMANLASMAGIYFLFQLVTALQGRAVARGTILLYLAFPTAFFFSLVYSESLFLLLIVLFFYLLLVKRRMDWAALPAAILPLARPEGVLVLLPFAAYWWVERRRLSREALFVLSPLLGAAAYLAYMRAATGNPLEMFRAMRAYVSDHSITYLFHPATLVRLLFEQPLALHGFTNSIIDRVVFLLFLLMLALMFRRIHPSLTVYAAAVGLLNVVSGTFMSYSRYVLLAFPAFVVLALVLRGRRVRWLTLPLAGSWAILQGLLLAMHALSYWVA